MELFRKYNVFVVSDEIWSDITLYGHKHIPTHALAVLGQGAVDDAVTAVIQLFGEADVSGGVDKNLVALGAHRA